LCVCVCICYMPHNSKYYESKTSFGGHKYFRISMSPLTLSAIASRAVGLVTFSQYGHCLMHDALNWEHYVYLPAFVTVVSPHLVNSTWRWRHI
jgi:hypothetical protein